MELKVLSTNIVEPITVADQKAFMGYSSTDQDAVIFRMIQAARMWLENRTGLSLVNKQYKAYFEKEDAVGGWYELPVSPVQSTPAIAVSVCGTSTTFEQMGLDKIKIKPDTLIGTIAVGAPAEIYYVEATFNAGATNDAANEILKRVVSSMFNAREDGGGAEVLTGRIPYDTMRLIEAIDQNTGF
jgi:uncharacterized phiE125 gp8 family phage protein